MNKLIVLANPKPESFCNAIVAAVSEELDRRNQEYALRDLYRINFSPALNLEDFRAMNEGTCSDDVRAEREFVTASDLLIFIFPVLMMNVPAMLKGYFERVLSLGFGFAIEDNGPVPLLNNKKAILFTTLHGTEEFSRKTGLLTALDVVSDYVLNGCGIEVLEHTYFYSVPVVSHEERLNMLDEVRKTIGQYAA